MASRRGAHGWSWHCTRTPHLGDEAGGPTARGGCRVGDGGRVLGLGDEEAGDRLVVGAGEGVLEVELEGVLVLLLPLPPQFLRRHVDGHAKGPREWWCKWTRVSTGARPGTGFVSPKSVLVRRIQMNGAHFMDRNQPMRVH